jgi:hypothetical protein
VLEILHVPAHHGGRQAQALRAGDEAAGLDDTDERLHGSKPIHGASIAV